MSQDEDALDTWFSSWLWPMSVFDGVMHPENKEYQYYYPTNDLVTAPDILFFWVARMIIAGFKFDGRKPFNSVYLTGIVRDKQRRKMSKSLGNSPDPISLMNEYGADGVRAGILMSSAAGNDLLFDESLMLQGRNFANKIWNGFRLVNSWKVSDEIKQPNSSKIATEWYHAKFQKTLNFIDEQFDKYRLSDALTAIYKLIWDDFSSWYLEVIKPKFGEPIDKTTYDATVKFFEDNMKILQPFMPFITENIWQCFDKRSVDEALIITKYPIKEKYSESILKDFEIATEVISAVRTIRKEKNISFKEEIRLSIIEKVDINHDFDELLKKMVNISKISYVKSGLENALSFRIKSNEYFIPVNSSINIEEELDKIQEELKYTKGFLTAVQKKLSNERFVKNAPEQVVTNEKKKEADALAKIIMLEESLKTLQH